MNTTETQQDNDQISPLGRLLAGGCFVTLLIVTLALCGTMGWAIFVMGAAEQMARNLAPPAYPESELTDQWQSGGTDSQWDSLTYQTDDDLQDVLAFFEQQMPGFVCAEQTTTGKTVCSNSASNNSWLARQASAMACSSLFCITRRADHPDEPFGLPGASVTIYRSQGEKAQRL